MPDLFTQRTCHFSPDRLYRYKLEIIWDATVKPQMFIGLNPSIADEEIDDPTVRRCIDYAQRWGAGGLVMTNACAYRATDPKVMLAFEGDKVGPENTIGYLERIASQCRNKPIAAWGKHAAKVGWTGLPGLDLYHNRHQELKQSMCNLDCLVVNKDGTPSHPLYLKAELLPRAFNY